MRDDSQGETKGTKPVRVKDKSRCYERRHMTMQEYGVYCYIRQVSHRTKIFYLDGRHLAEEFEGGSKDTAYRVINRLKKKGWLEETRVPKRLKNGMFANGQYRSLDHDEWVRCHPSSCHLCDTKESVTIHTDETGNHSSSPTSETSPVSNMQPSNLRPAPDQSQQCVSPVATTHLTSLTDETKVSRESLEGRGSREDLCKNNSNATPSRTRTAAAGPAGATAPPSKPKPAHTEEISETTVLTEVARVFTERGLPFKNPPLVAHKKLAMKCVREVGRQAFLTGLAHWLDTVQGNPDTVKDACYFDEGSMTYKWQTHLLRAYCISESGLAAMRGNTASHRGGRGTASPPAPALPQSLPAGGMLGNRITDADLVREFKKSAVGWINYKKFVPANPEAWESYKRRRVALAGNVLQWVKREYLLTYDGLSIDMLIGLLIVLPATDAELTIRPEGSLIQYAIDQAMRRNNFEMSRLTNFLDSTFAACRSTYTSAVHKKQLIGAEPLGGAAA